MNKKYVIIVNGISGSGKTTLEQYYTYCTDNSWIISAIDPIKLIVRGCIETVKRDAKTRLFLSRLKLLFDEYCEYSFQYLREQFIGFCESSKRVLFVDIREADQILKFKEYVSEYASCYVIKIERDIETEEPEEIIQEINKTKYDYVFKNDGTYKSKVDFFELIENIING